MTSHARARTFEQDSAAKHEHMYENGKIKNLKELLNRLSLTMVFTFQRSGDLHLGKI